MKRAFLSHNSADKEFVLSVYHELGHTNAIVDKYDFNEGVDLREQIKYYLNQSDLFVLFASKESLNAPWVSYEMNLAEISILNRDISNILVILVDREITHSDLPKWLQNSLVKQADNAKIAAKLIIDILKRKDDTLYLGRGLEHEKFSKHYFSSDKEAKNLVFFGLDGIGRRSFAKNILKQHFNKSISSEYSIEDVSPLDSLYRDLLIDFNQNISIEEINKNIEVFQTLIIEQQVKEIVHYLSKFSLHNQVPVLVDKDGMLNDEGEFRQEILELMKQINSTENLFVAYIQNRNPSNKYNNQYFVSYVPELNSDATEQLLKQYCTLFYNISLTKEDSIRISEYISGYPPTVKIAANEISIYGVDYIKEKPMSLIRYNSGVFDEYILKNVHKNEEHLLKIINNFGELSLTILMKLLPKLENELSRLIDLSIVTLNSDSKTYSISSPLKSALNSKFGVLSKKDYKNIVDILKKDYGSDNNVPDVKTLDILISSLLRADVNSDLEEFQKLILPSDISKNAHNAYKSKEWLVAKDLYEKLLKLDPDNLDALEFYIRSKIRLKEKTDNDLKRLHSLSIEKYLNVSAFKYMKSGDFVRAAKNYEKVKDNYYAPHYVFRELGECYYQLGELDKVRNILNAGLIKTSFKNKFMLDLAAKNAIRQNKFEDARGYIEYLEKVDNPGSVLHRKASLLSREGKFSEAKKLAEEAISDPNSRREFYLLLANIYINLNELDNAQKILNETHEKYKHLNISSDNGFLNLKCLYNIRKKNLKEAKEILDRINPTSEYLQLKYYHLVLETMDSSLLERIQAEQKVEELNNHEDSLIFIDI
ncbi:MULTISPECIES: tetratricopeptide repeat protein [Enterococcus]|uniref:tetratricopeptide repeat protein n=1 Tax=Enterococcus TaxID=1350 RepID=UPI001432D76E|nr:MULTISPECIES: tetratricopeptide repeat protein [Enterococcus]NKD30929.1 tetratricopeptide repeat protein [Enterococcus casseliflavus]